MFSFMMIMDQRIFKDLCSISGRLKLMRLKGQHKRQSFPVIFNCYSCCWLESRRTDRCRGRDASSHRIVADQRLVPIWIHPRTSWRAFSLSNRRRFPRRPPPRWNHYFVVSIQVVSLKWFKRNLKMLKKTSKSLGDQRSNESWTDGC